ncbi:hypothetical protein M8J76_005082 [Diaphorina citri]|nr:hypothetical protein M8J75_010728 [Diaphorina citri]KAI5732866.1 hypothetical protein M8J76_005082 [Diaphorina citri]
MSSIQPLLVKTYVNCVKFLNETYLLASAGNTLQVYNVITSQLLNSVTIFKCQRIHGIIVKDAQVLIYGGFDLALVKITVVNEKPAINIISKWTTENWVQDASFFEGNSYAVLGSSNVLYLYTLGDKIQLDRIAHCKEKSVLYSGKILGTRWDNAVVLCGTVFSQVTIWSPMLDECNIVHRLIGHKGVIFSVTYHEGNQTICSTSDDRTLRVWQVKMDNSDNTVKDWHNATVTLVYSIFGHTARVWKNLQLNSGKIISIGEDGQLRVWWQDKCVHYWNTHQNGNVWSMDYNEDSHLIVTGGGDGGICVWPLCEDNLTQLKQIDINFSTDDFPRQVVIARNKKLLVYTNNGTILTYKGDTCEKVLEDSRFKSYCILTISRNKRYYSAASIGGDILIFNEENDRALCGYNAGKEKIFSFHWLDESRFVICTSQGKLSLLHFDHENNYILETSKFVLPMCKERWLTSAVLADDLVICGDRDGSVHVYNLGTQCLLKTYHKIHSRLGVSCIEYNERDKTLMSIGRDGFLRYWEITKGIAKDDALSTRFSDVNTEVDNSHDSNLNNNTACDRTLLHVSADKLPLEWPVHIIPSIGDTLIIGFNEVNLVIWSTQEQKIILKLKCGGGHRSWDYCLEGSQFYFSFIKQKQVYHMDLDLSTLTRPALVQSFHRDEINTLRCVHMKNNLLISGGEDNTLRISVVSQTPLGLELQTRLILRSHISSIRCLNYVSLGRDVYIVSGGGRAQLKIWKVTCSGTEDSKEKEPGQIGNDNSGLEKEEINYGNNSNENKSIRSVEEYVNYGEKAPETECNKNFVQSNSIQSIPVQYQCKELHSHMLNGEDRKEKSWKHVTPRINPETRYMDIALHHAQSNLYIATACSDGYVRIFLYHIGTNGFSCIQELNYHRKCVLKVHLVEYDSRILLCSLSTNGDLAIWDFSSLINSASTTSGPPVNLNRTENSCRDITSLNNSRSRSTQKESTTQTDEKSDLLRAESSKPSLGNTESTFLLPTPLPSSLSQDRLILSQEEPPNLATPLPLLTIHLHRGGVNSFDSRPVGTDLILVSGGDDCSLNLTVLTRELNQRYQRRQRRAHNSQITGVKFLDDERFVSTSVDQQIIVWTWEGEKGLSQEEISAQQKRNLSQEKISNQQKKLSQENGILSEEISSQHTRSSNQNEKLSQGILSQEKSNLSQEKCDLNHEKCDLNQEKGNLSLHKNSSQTEGVLSQELVKLSQYESCIPDIHGLDLVSKDQVCVFGCGVNIVHIESSTSS